jgi:hypothetical protein
MLEPKGTIRAPAAHHEEIAMKSNSSFAALVFIVILGAGAAMAYAAYRVSAGIDSPCCPGLRLYSCFFRLFRNSGCGSMEQGSRVAAW